MAASGLHGAAIETQPTPAHTAWAGQVAPAHTLSGSLEHALEALALNMRQHRLIWNPTPETDSLVEQIINLRHHGVPDDVIHPLIDSVQAILRLNAAEREQQRNVAGTLDELETLRRRAVQPGVKVSGPLGIRAVTNLLRPALRVLATPDDCSEVAEARRVINDVIDRCPPSQLLSETLRHQMGGRFHDRLRALMNERVAA